MTSGVLISCVLCPREAACEGLCWPCFHHLGDLLSDRPGSSWDPKRPDEAYVPPGCVWLLAEVAVHDGQRSIRPEPASRPAGGFRSQSPADDTVIAIRDLRSRADDYLPWIIGQRWIGLSPGQIAAHLEVSTARQELRSLQRHLLALLGDGHGPRWVGSCRMLVNADGDLLADEGLALMRAHAREGQAYADDSVYTCAAPLWSRPAPPCGDDESPPLPSVRCPSCRHVYGGAALARMGRVDVDEEVAA